jgi:hypothetical protein
MHLVESRVIAPDFDAYHGWALYTGVPGSGLPGGETIGKSQELFLYRGKVATHQKRGDG